jgi:hypothetical protein
MKKIVIIILLLGLGAFIFSCGDNGGTAQAENTDPQTQTADLDTPEPEVTPATTEEPTEPPATTEPPVITYEIIKRFTFDDPDDIGWRAANQIQNFRVEDGLLKLTSIGGDPFFMGISPLDIEASEIDIIRIRALNLSSNENCQFFFDTDIESGLSESKSFRAYHWHYESEPDSDQWNEIIIYTDECDYWEGVIKTVRFDPIEDEGEVYIEYISFEKRTSE